MASTCCGADYKRCCCAFPEKVSLKTTERSKGEDGEESLLLTWGDGHSCHFNSFFLRVECTCDRCQHSSGQKMISFPSLPEDLHPSSSSVDESQRQLTVQWSDGHVSTFKSNWLRANCCCPETMKTLAAEYRPPPFTSTSSVPSVQYKDIMEEGDTVHLYRWLFHLQESGLCVVKNVPCELGQVRKVAERISKISHTVLYGDIFDVVNEPQPINIAYTGEALSLHQDLPYYESPPGLQLLHCVRFDKEVEGGESTFLDTFAAVAKLREEDPKAFEDLTRIPGTFRKIHWKRKVPAVIEYQRPHIQLNHLGEVVSVFWSPAFEGTLKVPSPDVPRYYRAYRALSRIMNGEDGVCPAWGVTFRLQEGDCVIWNQRRILHGRRAFTSALGHRHLQGTYVMIDDFLSRYRVLKEKFGTEEEKRVEFRACHGSYT